MAEIELDILVDGEGTLDDDYKAVMNALITATASTLTTINETLRDGLKKHIDEDVYAKYKPRVYKRRRDDVFLGTPLNDMSQATLVDPIGGKTADGNISLMSGLEYDPTGEHEKEEWSDVNENELIGRIEKQSPPYSYTPKKGKIPDRPFWQNFINEMVDGGVIGSEFVMRMRSAGVDIEMSYEEVEREPRDGDY